MDDQFLDKLRGIIQEEKAWSGVPGVTVSLVHGDETAFLCEGFRNREEQLPVTSKTLFIIASCSKSMTTAMLGRLVDEGILDWDVPVCHYAPELQMADPQANANMSLRDMCLHRTGLADHDGAWPILGSRAEMAKRLKYLEPNLRFREKRQYNNVIYALTAYVAEQASGKSYDALMKEYIFDPLGMRNTYTAHADYLSSPDAAEPYYYCKPAGIIRQEKWNMDSAVAAAAIATDAEDMAKWLRFNISGGLGPDGKRLLSQKSWETIHHAGIEAYDATPNDFAFYHGYGFGWWEGSYRGHSIYMHTGKINGFSSLEVFMPEIRSGVFVSQNLHAPEKHLYARLAYTAFDEWLGIPNAGDDWKNAYHGTEACSTKVWTEHDFNEMPPRAMPPASPSMPLASYCGVYQSKGYGRMTVDYADGALSVFHNIYRCPLHPYDGDIFQADEFWEDVKNITMPLSFVVHSGDKHPSSVIVPMEKQVKPIEFIRISE